jgi:uncharacterized protein DUF2568
MGNGLAWLNATVAFGLELAALAVLGWAGWHVDGPVALRVLLAVALPAVAAVLWGLHAAPRAAHPSPGGRLAVQALVFGAAAVLLAWAAAPRWGAAFAALVAVNLLAAAALPSVGTATT